jgi:polar amino acid transport system permease protein
VDEHTARRRPTGPRRVDAPPALIGRGWRASTLVLLSAVPFVVVLFVTTDSYRRALAFILPGIGATITAAVIAYLVAMVLGLLLAWLLVLRAGADTWRRSAYLGAAGLLVATVLWLQPREAWALVGTLDPGGRVAIVRGTPSGLSDAIRSGAWRTAGLGAPDDERVAVTVRAVESVEAALQRLGSGEVAAAFVPLAAAPDGVTRHWEVAFLRPTVARLAILFTVFGFAVAMLALGARLSGQHPLAIFAELYVDTLRGIPMLVVILYVGFPLQGALREATGGVIDMSRMTRGVAALALGYAAYMAEIFRAGIEAVPSGQREAARSLGLGPWQTTRYVVLPQALRIVVPPLGNEFIAMLKDTSLLSILSVRDITQRAREFQASTFMTFPPYNTVALLYIGLTLAASSLVKWVERRAAWTR